MKVNIFFLLSLELTLFCSCGSIIPSRGDDPIPAWVTSKFPQALAKYEIQRTDDTAAPISIVSVNFPQPDWSNLPMQVFTDKGEPVSTQVIWSASNSPTTLVFDSSSGDKSYSLLVGLSSNPVRLQKDQAFQAGVWLETREGDNRPIKDWDKMLKKWSRSSNILGRTVINGMALGGNGFGAEQPVYVHLLGWFNNSQMDTVTFTVNSSDHCFVLLDKNLIISFPDLNSATVFLPPGIHSLEYYSAHIVDYRHRPMAGAVAIKSPHQWNNLDENSHFFIPCGNANIIDYEGNPDGYNGKTAPPCSFQYITTEQSVLSPDDPDHAFISMKLSAFPSSSDYHYTWSFDDGTTVTGETVNHTFLRPGDRIVQLNVSHVKQGDLGGIKQNVGVHLDPTLLIQEEPGLFNGQKINQDLSKLSSEDLSDSVVLLETYDEVDGLAKVIPFLTPKLADVKDIDLPFLFDAAEKLSDKNPEHESAYAHFVPALIDRCEIPGASPTLVTLLNQTRLSFASFQLETSDHLDQIDALLKSIDTKVLSDDENRSLQLVRADWQLASGHVVEAKDAYELLDKDDFLGNTRNSVQVTGRIGQARAFLDQGDFPSAEDALAEVRSWAPGIILRSDWEMVRLNLYQAEKQQVRAYLWAKRLLNVITPTDSVRPELLYQTAALALAESDSNLVAQVLDELQKSHPFSEEFAKARKQWPDLFSSDLTH